jgi:hypothetical protein
MQALIAELQKPLYAGMTEVQAAAELNAVDKTEVYSRFGSFRTLANLLTETEYAPLKTALTAAAQQSAVVADMIEMLKLPGDEQGSGGGIDFGAASVRAKIDAMQSALATAIGGENAAADAAALCAKVKGYAERTTSTAAMLGLGNATENDVHNARAVA